MLDDENLIDQIGMIQQDAFALHHVEKDNIAIFARHAAHGIERIVAQIERGTDDGQSLRPWWNSISNYGHVCECSPVFYAGAHFFNSPAERGVRTVEEAQIVLTEPGSAAL
jgi:hypothetical protein